LEGVCNFNVTRVHARECFMQERSSERLRMLQKQVEAHGLDAGTRLVAASVGKGCRRVFFTLPYLMGWATLLCGAAQ
jgi:hypothetical protein